MLYSSWDNCYHNKQHFELSDIIITRDCCIPSLSTQSHLTTCYASRHYASATSYLHLVFIRYFRLLVLLVP